MKTLIDALRKASDKVNDLENKILNSDEYEELKNESAKISERIDEMNVPLNKIREDVVRSKLDLMAWIIENKEYESKYYNVTFKERKEVNKEKLFRVIGDTDLYVTLSTITQKNLIAYGKEHKDIKKSLDDCVEVVEKIPTQVTLI